MAVRDRRNADDDARIKIAGVNLAASYLAVLDLAVSELAHLVH